MGGNVQNSCAQIESDTSTTSRVTASHYVRKKAHSQLAAQARLHAYVHYIIVPVCECMLHMHTCNYDETSHVVNSQTGVYVAELKNITRDCTEEC